MQHLSPYDTMVPNQSILNRLDDISQELFDAGHTALADQINTLFHAVEKALRASK